jgi:hypothetical protein
VSPLWSDPAYRTLAEYSAAIMGTGDGDIVAAILAQWTCEKGNADAYPPSRNNPGNLTRGAASGLGIPFTVTYPNPQPGNPVVTYATPRNGAHAYAKLIMTGSRYGGVRAAVRLGNGRAYIVAMGDSGYGTSTACMLSTYHPPAPAPVPPPEVDPMPCTLVGSGHIVGDVVAGTPYYDRPGGSRIGTTGAMTVEWIGSPTLADCATRDDGWCLIAGLTPAGTITPGVARYIARADLRNPREWPSGPVPA